MSAQLEIDPAGLPLIPLRPFANSADLERRETEKRIAALHRQMHWERRVKFYRNLASFWPIALGVALSLYAPSLRDMAGSYASWAAKLLLPLWALTALHQAPVLWSDLPAVSQFMLYAQFPLDGLIACRLVRQRSSLWNVGGQLAFLHAIFLLCITLETASFVHML